jgi:Zn-dependent protease
MTIIPFTSMLLVSVIAHEGAHALMAENLGLRTKKIEISWRGIGIVRERGTLRQNLAVALAGPAINLLLAWIWWNQFPVVAECNLFFGMFNLLWPNAASDGGRALAAMKDLKWI